MRQLVRMVLHPVWHGGSTYFIGVCQFPAACTWRHTRNDETLCNLSACTGYRDSLYALWYRVCTIAAGRWSSQNRVPGQPCRDDTQSVVGPGADPGLWYGCDRGGGCHSSGQYALIFHLLVVCVPQIRYPYAASPFRLARATGVTTYFCVRTAQCGQRRFVRFCVYFLQPAAESIRNRGPCRYGRCR